MRNRKDALAAGGRRTGKELRVPVPGRPPHFKNGRGNRDLHQETDRRGRGDRHGRMHARCTADNDRRRWQPRGLRHLDHGQQRQQRQAHQRHQPVNVRLCAAIAAGTCLDSGEQTALFLKNTQNWMRAQPPEVTIPGGFQRHGPPTTAPTGSSKLRGHTISGPCTSVPCSARGAAGLAGVLLAATLAGIAQNQKPLPLKPGIPGMGSNHRLILKDGTYQMVRTVRDCGRPGALPLPGARRLGRAARESGGLGRHAQVGAGSRQPARRKSRRP